jgi:hypothetical protein
VRVADGAIRVDGRLDDDAWQHAPPLTDFVQKEPVEGAAPSDRMEVRFAYPPNPASDPRSDPGLALTLY